MLCPTGDKRPQPYSQCDSLHRRQVWCPIILPLRGGTKRHRPLIEHEATTSKISEDQLFYCNQRGIDPEEWLG